METGEVLNVKISKVCRIDDDDDDDDYDDGGDDDDDHHHDHDDGDGDDGDGDLAGARRFREELEVVDPYA